MSEEKEASTYQTIAETVGMVPSLNAKDNLYQGIFVGLVSLNSVIVGYFVGGYNGALGLLLVGLIGSAFLSGGVIMVLGFVRAAKKASKK